MNKERNRPPRTRPIHIFTVRQLAFRACSRSANDDFLVKVEPPRHPSYSSHSFGSRFVMKSDMRLAAAGSMLAKTAITQPGPGQISRSPFIPGAPPPCPKHRVPLIVWSPNPYPYRPRG